MDAENSRKPAVKLFLNSDDPLCDDAIKTLISHKEEDLYVDYKETFDPKDEKAWLGITSDVMAFANTVGGYIVFGVKDGEFSVVGIPDSVAKQISDTNMVMQKLNRYVAPSFTMLRAKKNATESGNIIVVIYVPESKGKTHMFVKPVNYTYPSGKTVQLARPGMIFIRRSATNSIVQPEDFDFIINRRIERYKDTILSKIAKVVEAPAEHQVLIFDPEAQGNNAHTFSISDSPDAIPVKGMSFTVVPRSDIEELCGYISLSKRDPSFQVNEQRLWYFYSIRMGLTLNREQTGVMVSFSLLRLLPVFYWLRSLSGDQIKQILTRTFEMTKAQRVKTEILQVSAFLGPGFYKMILKKFGESVNRLSQKLRRFPNMPFDLFNAKPEDRLENCATLERRLTEIATELSNGKGGVMKKILMKKFDCSLYARQDKYVAQTPKKNGHFLPPLPIQMIDYPHTEDRSKAKTEPRSMRDS